MNETRECQSLRLELEKLSKYLIVSLFCSWRMEIFRDSLVCLGNIELLFVKILIVILIFLLDGNDFIKNTGLTIQEV